MRPRFGDSALPVTLNGQQKRDVFMAAPGRGSFRFPIVKGFLRHYFSMVFDTEVPKVTTPLQKGKLCFSFWICAKFTQNPSDF